MFLISIKTLEVKWCFLIKRVWSASKEVAEVYGKKHSCRLLENACEPCKVLGSKRTLWLADDWPCYPGRRVHPPTLHSNPPPAWTLWVPYSWKLIYLSPFHWIIIKPLGSARDQSMIAPVVSKSIASLDAVVAYSDKATLCWKESPQQLRIRDRAMFKKWCMQCSIRLSFWTLAQLLKREWTYAQEDCMDMAVPNSRLLVALLQLFSKHRPIDDSLCSVVMPHTLRRAPQISTSGWKLRSSFELIEHKVDSSSGREGAPWSPHPYKAQSGRKATSWAAWSRTLITLSTAEYQLYCPRLQCDLGLSNSWISLHYNMEKSGQYCLAIRSLMGSQSSWCFCATNDLIPKLFKYRLPETILLSKE